MSETQIAQELESRTLEHLGVADVMERAVRFAQQKDECGVMNDEVPAH